MTQNGEFFLHRKNSRTRLVQTGKDFREGASCELSDSRISACFMYFNVQEIKEMRSRAREVF